jgi:hypothetical protein
MAQPPPTWPPPPNQYAVPPRVRVTPLPPLSRPVRVEPFPGTGFGVAYLGVTAPLSGLAIGSLVAGILSILVTTLVFCFGVAGSSGGWGALVAGAFAILSGLVGAAAVVAGLVAGKQIRTPGSQLRGTELAIAGAICGGSGIGLTALGFVMAVLLS